MNKVTLDILAQIILSSSGLLKNASKLSLFQSHTIVQSLGDTGSRSKPAIHLSVDPCSHEMCLYMYTNKNEEEILTFCSAKAFFVRTTWHIHENHATTQQLYCKLAAPHSLGATIEISGVDEARVGDWSWA